MEVPQIGPISWPKQVPSAAPLVGEQRDAGIDLRYLLARQRVAVDFAFGTTQLFRYGCFVEPA